MDRSAATSSPERTKDLALYAIAAGAVVVGILWLAGAAAARLAGHPVPRHRPLGELAAFGDFANPSAGWGAPVGPPVLYWAVTFTILAVLVVAGCLGWRLLRRAHRWEEDDPTRVEGLADRHHIVTAAGPKILLARAPILRPSLSHPRPVDVGYCLGTSRGVGCWASVEDSIVVLGPPRSGKGYHLVIPSILDAPGAVITTGTRADNLTTTITARAKVGPVAVFDPQGLAAGVPSTLRWSPVRGCQRPQTAMIRAHALCADTGAGTENGNFWRQQTITAVRCLLHAAALGERPPADLYRWSLSAPAAKDAVDILLRSGDTAAPAWEKALDAIISAEARQRDSIWAMVANAFACLGDPQVLAAVTPREGEVFDPAGFLRAKGTLFLLGTATGASATASLVAALVEDVVDVARRMAGASAGARLDPPLGLILDEAANYPLPSLGSLMSEGGGSGITTIAVLQSLAQARDKWGTEMGQAIWDAAIAKVILGGGSNADDLADISRLIGERSVRDYTETSQAGGGKSISESNRDRAILDPAALRAIGPGHGLLLLRSARPIMLTLRPWTARADAARLGNERAGVETSLRSAAQDDWGNVA
ncbi:MAG: type IV secretory system conjugative DNA transfer family protein [Acidimicrobiales bacterium]